MANRGEHHVVSRLEYHVIRDVPGYQLYGIAWVSLPSIGKWYNQLAEADKTVHILRGVATMGTVPETRKRQGRMADKNSEPLLRVVAQLSDEISAGHGPNVTLDSNLERELGFDSLARVELLHRIETALDATLSEQVLHNAETPRDLIQGLLDDSRQELGETKAGTPRPDAPSKDSRAVGEMPSTVTTLTAALAWQAEQRPETIHLHLDDGSGETEDLTFAEVYQQALALAAGLTKQQLAPGEPVLLMLPTGRDYFISFMGVLFAGGIPVPVYPPGRASEIEEHIRRHSAIGNNCQAAVMITDPAALKFSTLMTSLVPSLRKVTTTGELIDGEPNDRHYLGTPEETAFIQYTSGSTGDPKGVVLSHANLMANIRAMGQALQADANDVFVSWLPLYHDMGLIGAWLGSLVHGIPLVIMSPLTFLARPERWLRAIHRFGGTISGAPNFAYEACVRRIPEKELEGLDLSSWRVAFNGAEPVSVQTMEAFCERFEPYGFRRDAMMPVYGLAENCVGVTFPPLGRGPRLDEIDRERLMRTGEALPAAGAPETIQRLPACGIPIPGHQVRVVDTDGRELPERREGRVQFTGPSSTAGYLRNPEANNQLFDDEWVNSGDLGYIADGELFVTGRAKDIIIRAGRNIFPAELEAAVGEINGIQRGNVAAFGAPDPESETERLVVVAETRHLDDTRQAKLRQEIIHLAVNLVGTPPDDVVLVPPRSVPKTSSGKIRRQSARALYLSGNATSKPASVKWQLMRLAFAALPGLLSRWTRRWRDWIYGIWSWAVLIAVAPLAWILVLLSPSRSIAWRIARAGLSVMRAGTGLGIAVNGVENLPANGAYILVANHSSYLDGPVLMYGLPRRFSFVAKSELAGQFVAGPFLKRLGTEFVERFDASRGAEDAGRLTSTVQSGQPLIYFPEGTLSRMPGLLPFHMGAFSAAVEAEVPIVPVVIRGTRHALRDGTTRLRPGAVSITILPPVTPRTMDRSDSWNDAITLRDQVRADMLGHLGEPDLAHERILPPRPEE